MFSIITVVAASQAVMSGSWYRTPFALKRLNVHVPVAGVPEGAGVDGSLQGVIAGAIVGEAAGSSESEAMAIAEAELDRVGAGVGVPAGPPDHGPIPPTTTRAPRVATRANASMA
jgi:hypothetical protein